MPKLLRYLPLLFCFLWTTSLHAQTANFTVDPSSSTTGCPPLVVKFKNLSSGATSYEWEFGVPAPNTSNLTDPQWIFYKPGTYTVKLKAINGSSSNTVTKVAYITVHDTPKVDFTANNLTGCAPLSVSFTNLTQPNAPSATYAWYLGGGTPSTFPGANPGTVVFNSGGSNTITLEATNSYGCKTFKSRPNYINVKAKPVITFTGAPLTFCKPPGEVEFNSTITGTPGYTYLWRFGDGNTSPAPNPKYTYYLPSPQSYNVRLIVTDANGCKDSLTKPGYVNFVKTIANFQSPATACVGTNIIFTNTTAPCMTTSLWDFDYPNGPTATDNHAMHTYMTPGTKTIRLITWCGNCPDTITKQIVINPLPNVDFVSKPDSPCPATQVIQYQPNGTYSSYLWTFGSLASPGSATSNATAPTRTYTANGFDTVTLTVNDANGCSNTKTKAPAVKIFDLYTDILADTSSGCAPLTVKFNSMTYTYIQNDGTFNPTGPPFKAYPYGVKTYYWQFGDGTDSYLKNPTKVFNDSGTFTVTLTITTNNNCVIQKTFIVKVGVKPLASFTGPNNICYKDKLILTNTAPPKHNSYLWIWGDGETTFTKDGEHKYKHPSNPKMYCVKLINYYNGCPSDTFQKCIMVDSPKARFSVKTSCHKDSLKHIKFVNESIGATSWFWDFGDGNTNTTSWDTLYKYTNNGVYTVRLIAYNAASGCTDTFTRNVNIASPYVTFTANDTAVCKGDAVQITGVLHGSIATGYYWTRNGVAFPTSFTPVFDTTYSDTGTFKIKLVISDENNCEYSLEKPYIFVSKPYVEFLANPMAGCVPLTVDFTDQTKLPKGATVANRYWDFGTPPSANGTGVNTQKIYNNAGSYTIKLVVTDNVGCKDSLERPGYVNAYKPVANFLVKDNACLDELLTFTNSSLNYNTSYWEFGDGGTSTSNQPDHAYNALGSYTVKLIVEDLFGCKDTLETINKVKIDKPFPAFSMSDSVAVCPPFPVTFTNLTPNQNLFNYQWKTGMNTIGGPTATEAYINPGIYVVTLVATSVYGCRDSVQDTVKLYGFAGSLSYTPTLGCVPLDVTFTPNGLSNVPMVTWDFTDGSTLTSTTLTPVTHTYTVSGTYLPKLILQDSKGCKATSDGLDSIRVDEAWAGFSSGPACEFQEMQFYDTSKGLYSGIISRLWVFDTGTSIKKDPKRYYGASGQYPVILTVISGNNCKDTIQKNITIHPLPDIDAGKDTVICLKDSAILMPTGGVSYKWTPAVFLNCDTCNNPLAGPTSKYVYKVVGTDINGCKNTDSVTVGVKTKVTAEVGPGGEICDKDTFGLYVSGAWTYEWKPAESLDDSKSSAPVSSARATTNYIVVAYEGSCIPDTNAVKLIVHPLPLIKAEGGTTIVAGNTADLRASGERIARFRWSPVEDLNCSDCAFPVAKPSVTTTYTVFAYTDKGCVDSAKVDIIVLCDKSQLFIPNTFTPNGDGQNDVFFPRGEGMDKIQSFRIYNRWGEVVFERRGFDLNDQVSGWDGTFKGNQLPPDVFVWVLDAQCDDGKVLTLKGDVTIIR